MNDQCAISERESNSISKTREQTNGGNHKGIDGSD